MPQLAVMNLVKVQSEEECIIKIFSYLFLGTTPRHNNGLSGFHDRNVWPWVLQTEHICGSSVLNNFWGTILHKPLLSDRECQLFIWITNFV